MDRHRHTRVLSALGTLLAIGAGLAQGAGAPMPIPLTLALLAVVVFGIVKAKPRDASAVPEKGEIAAGEHKRER